MATYTVAMRDECGSTEHETITAADLDEARESAEEATETWVRGGEWGDSGASVDAYWRLYEGDQADESDPIDEGSITVQIEPDEAALMQAAGAPDDCDHHFVATYEVEGGCRENPGVWSAGGTTLVYRSHCEHCGLQKREVQYGTQRNPGQCDIVEYEMPEPALEIED